MSVTVIYMYNQVITVSHNTLIFIIYYFSEHLLPPVIDASYTMRTTRVNRSPKLLKLIGWRHCPYFGWVLYIPGTTTQIPGAEPDPTASNSNSTHSITVEQYSQ